MLMIRPLAVALLVCSSGFARAQEAPNRGSGLTVSFVRIQENRRDDADSPIAYAGSGPGGRIEYEGDRPGRRTYFALSGGGSTLTPAAAVGQADIPPLQEGFDAFDLRAGTQWHAGPLPGVHGDLFIGVEADAAITLVRHAFAGQGTSHQSFDLGVATIGPTARWSRRTRSGEFAASLGVPLVALIDHPYADVRLAAQVSRLRIESLSRVRQADGGLSYELALGGGTGVVAQYGLSVFVLDDLEPIRRVSQSLSLGFTRQFGRLR